MRNVNGTSAINASSTSVAADHKGNKATAAKPSFPTHIKRARRLTKQTEAFNIVVETEYIEILNAFAMYLNSHGKTEAFRRAMDYLRLRLPLEPYLEIIQKEKKLRQINSESANVDESSSRNTATNAPTVNRPQRGRGSRTGRSGDRSRKR